MPCAVNATSAVTATTLAERFDPNCPPDVLDEEPEFAFANGVAFLGQLSASIAEINQPISAVIMNAEAGLRLLVSQPTDTEAIRRLLTSIINDGMRTGDIVNRTRALTDRKRADERLRASEQRLLDVQMELGHVTRMMTLGEMTASLLMK